MHSQSFFKTAAFLFLLITFSTLATPVAITTASVDFSSMVTNLVFEGTPQIDVSDYGFYRSAYLNSQSDIGSGEGIEYLRESSSQAFSGTSSENGLSVFTSSSTPGTIISCDTDFHRTFDVENLKEITLEYDWNALVCLHTDVKQDIIKEFTEHWAELYTSAGTDYSNFYTQSADAQASGGQDAFINNQDHVRFHYLFDSPYSGPLTFRGGLYTYTVISEYPPSSVPEPQSTFLIISGVVSLLGFAFCRQNKSNL